MMLCITGFGAGPALLDSGRLQRPITRAADPPATRFAGPKLRRPMLRLLAELVTSTDLLAIKLRRFRMVFEAVSKAP